jgi:hypothetical protein
MMFSRADAMAKLSRVRMVVHYGSGDGLGASMQGRR